MSHKTKRTTKGEPPKTMTTTPNEANPRGPIYFWRPQEATAGYLSQWYAQPFRDRNDKDKIYATAEHYMMHHKALLFNDAEIAAAILETTSPRDVKELGRAVRGLDNAVWERERGRIVTEGNWCKFTLPAVEDSHPRQDTGGAEGPERGDVIWKLGNGDSADTMRAPSFRDVLLATGTRELVEASPFDRIWDVGFAAKGAERNRRKWGLNLLGKCLMEVREQFRGEAKEEENEKEGDENS